MGFLWWRKNKKDKEIRISFDAVKQDLSKTTAWIRHLNTKTEHHDSKIDEIFYKVSKIQQDIDELKQFVSFFDTRIASKVFKAKSTGVDKHTAVEGVQTPVYTAVQTAFLKGLTTNERIILWILLNSNMKLSCEDIAVLLGKDSSTVRSQINNIKQKNESWVNESIEKTGKKRYYVDEKMKEFLLKRIRPKSKKIGQSESMEFNFEQ